MQKTKGLDWQFASNTISTIVNLLVQFGINFFLTSYLISSVGSTAYGFFSMANSIVNYALIITVALNSLSSRFIGIGIYNNDNTRATRYFSSIFMGDILFALFIILPCVICISNLEKIINIPLDLVQDVKILFFIVFINMCFNIVFSVFGCVFIIRNRLDLSSFLQTISNIVKSILLIILYARFKPSIVFLGTATLVATIIVIVGNVYYTHKFLPELHFNIRLTKFSTLVEVISSGIWNSFNQLSITLLNGLDLVIANMMVSAEAMGYLSVANTIPGVISTVISALSNMFTPNFLKYYSHGNYSQLYKEVKNSIRFMTIISCMPISFLIAFGVPFFKLWTPGTDVQAVYVLSVLILLPQLTGGAISSMNYLYTVANKVKWQAIVLFIAGIANIVSVFLLLNFTDIGVYAIAGVSAVIGFIRNFLFNAPYAAHCIHKPIYIFWGDMLKSCFCLGICTAIGVVINYIFVLDTWISLIFVGGSCTVVTGGIVAIIVLGKEQKEAIISALKNWRK